MKSIFSVLSGLLIIITSIVVVSCEYNEVVDNVDFPEQTIYMPAAINGVYDISVKIDPVASPTEGAVGRYTIDNNANKLNVQLGAYRSGVSKEGDFTVDITFNNDSVSQMISSGQLQSTEVFPLEKASLPTSIKVTDGKDFATFNLGIDIDFVKNNPDKQYAIGVKISSSERKVNTKLGTTIVLVKTSSLQF